MAHLKTKSAEPMRLLDQYDTHPAADLFPMMPEQDLEHLAADIKRNGLNRPITMYESKVLDGRNRLLACNRAGTRPTFEEFDGLGHDSPTSWVLSQNLYRRHLNLTESQRALIGAGAKALFEAEAAARTNAKQDGDTAKRDHSERGLNPAEQAAKAAGISVRSVEHAARVCKTAAPELVDAVKRGEASVSAAALLVDESAQRQRELVAAGPKAIKEAAREKRKSRLGDAERARLEAMVAGKELDPEYDSKRVNIFVGRTIAISKIENSENIRALLCSALECLTATEKQVDALNRSYEDKYYKYTSA